MRLHYKSKYYEGPVTVELAHYANDRLAIKLTAADAFPEPVATATVNIPEEPLALNEVLIKDWSENEGMLAWLIREQLVNPPTRMVPAGYCEAACCTIGAKLAVLLRENHNSREHHTRADRCKAEGHTFTEELHPCPYTSDVENDSTPVCHCCAKCQAECAADI